MSDASMTDRPAARDRLAQAWRWARANGARATLEILINFVAPYFVYRSAQPLFGDVQALMAASAPPLAYGLVEFARARRIDALSLLALAGIAFTLLAFLGGGGANALQMREQLVLAVIGLIFLGSAAIGKPLIYQLARARVRRRLPAQAEAFEALQENPAFRRAMMTMTLVWGISLVIETALACVLIFVLSIQQRMLISPIVGYSTIGGLTAWTYWYARRAIKRSKKR